MDKRFNLSLEQVDCPVNKLLTIIQFIKEYEKPNTPVILQGAMKLWLGVERWKPENFLRRFGETAFKTNGRGPDDHCFKMKFRDYLSYMKHNIDEKPLYMFDNKFLERFSKKNFFPFLINFFFFRAPEILEDYTVKKNILMLFLEISGS